jgi:hypothetical protein
VELHAQLFEAGVGEAVGAAGLVELFERALDPAAQPGAG